jgi:ribosomal protein S18 acetylase RimI-like enzyme
MNFRRYEPRDRDAVRGICCDTADCGNPVESFFPDREVFADLLTRYYTDFDSRASWVADAGNEIAGYILGAYDTRRFNRVLAWQIVPCAVVKAIVRGALWHSQTRALLWANRGFMFRECSGGENFQPEHFPARVHINLRASYRGRNIGRELFRCWLEQARAAGVAGVHANVNADNAGGCRFFEAMGFCPLGREARMRLPGSGRMLETVMYGLRLDG